MSITLERPPRTEERREWADWFNKLWLIVTTTEVAKVTDATRGNAGNAGRVVFNSDDGNLNIDDGSQWILPDGTPT